MPSLEKTLVQSCIDKEKCLYPNFVETGTYKGETILTMEDMFTSLYTIDICKDFVVPLLNRYGGGKIKFIFGDSVKMLTHIIPLLKDNTVFFLDAHWSGGDTGRGDKDCPLLEEIEIINKLFKYDGILIVDDCRMFEKYPSVCDQNEDWENISKDNIVNILNDRIIDTYYLPSTLYEEDRLVISIEGV